MRLLRTVEYLASGRNIVQQETKFRKGQENYRSSMHTAASNERVIWQVLRPEHLRGESIQLDKKGQEMWAIGATPREQVERSSARWLREAERQIY